MLTIALYLIGPVVGLLIYIIGLVTSLGESLTTGLGIAFGIALMVEFGVVLSIFEETEKKLQEEI